MEIQLPSAQNTLLILLGASAWPLFPEFQSSKAFAQAARGVKTYFLDPKRFGLSPENLLELFDSKQSPDELDVEIGQFLERRITAMKAAGHAARDVLLYFVGHGGFVGHDSDFYLAIRRTRQENPYTSGVQVIALADTLTKKARHLRRIIILDCCFASAAFTAFQAGPAQVALEKTRDAFEVGQKGVGFPAKGTALLCSSNHKSPSLLLPDGSSTMFTTALLDALAEGMPSQRERLSLREVKDIAADLLSKTRDTGTPTPVVLSPDQSEGDVADIPFFPNPHAEDVLNSPSPFDKNDAGRSDEDQIDKPEAKPRSFASIQFRATPLRLVGICCLLIGIIFCLPFTHAGGYGVEFGVPLAASGLVFVLPQNNRRLQMIEGVILFIVGTLILSQLLQYDVGIYLSTGVLYFNTLSLVACTGGYDTSYQQCNSISFVPMGVLGFFACILVLATASFLFLRWAEVVGGTILMGSLFILMGILCFGLSQNSSTGTLFQLGIPNVFGVLCLLILPVLGIVMIVLPVRRVRAKP